MTIARFKITSPVPGFHGEGAARTYFDRGVAELSVNLDSEDSTSNGKGALSHFRQLGFGVEPLDGVTVEQALTDAVSERAALLAERDALTAQASLDELRAEVAELRAKAAPLGEQGGDSGAQVAPATPPADITWKTDIPAPAPDASVSDWRAWAVTVDPALTATAAKALDRDAIRSTYAALLQEGPVA